MEAHTLQRVGAVIIDIFLLSFMLLLLTFWIPNSEKYEEAAKKENEILDNLLSDDTDTGKIINNYMENRYIIEKESIMSSAISMVLTLGYFATFAFYNNGQTIGKRIMKIKVVNKDGSEVNHRTLFFRTILIQGVFASLLSIMFLLFIKPDQYLYTVWVVNAIQSLITITTALMILCRDDKRGLHDLIFKTKVIQV